MATERTNRLNELARKQKAEGLTPAEQEEQARLRKEYLAAFRANMTAQLDNVIIVNPDGTSHALKKKQK